MKMDQAITQAKHILVVEDYLDSQEITCELIRLMGYTVDGVANAEDALAYLTDKHVDIMLTDINLPRMSGLELAKRASEKNTGLKIIIASGHANLDLNHVNFPARLLTKPFDFDALENALKAND